MKTQSWVCFVAGRSGGHIIPALTLVQHYKGKNPHTNILFISTNTQVDKKLLSNQSIIDQLIHISLGNFPYTKLYRYPLFLWQLSISLFKSFYYLVRYRPQKITAMGGYISIPVCAIAWLLRIPHELFELNVVPGKTTNFLASLVPRINICFEQTKQHLPVNKCYPVAYPVRFSASAKTIAKKEALATLTFLSTRTTIMILGGSQGSSFINDVMKKWIKCYFAYHSKIQIIHQTGLLHDQYVLEEFYAKNNIPAFVFDYSDELEYCYQATDLIICRSGAGTLFEVCFFQKPCITIPLETEATTHQYYNAKAMKNLLPTLFIVIKQNELNDNLPLLNKAIVHFTKI